MFEQFKNAYIEAIYFTDTGDFDQPASDAELSYEIEAQIKNDCRAFLADCGDMFTDNVTQAGHDFWLTRNGHGAGFWDRPEIYGKISAELLTAACKGYGQFDIYLGDDGLVYGA